MSGNLCTDIGYRSLFKHGEELCGDHVCVSEAEDGSSIAVLADGLGSGVKASILSTLTSKMLSTMLAAGLSLEDCVQTIIQTLPVCKEREVAYSTFTVIRITPDRHDAEVIQYDNPKVILLRDGKGTEIPYRQILIEDKVILKSHVDIKEDDIFIMMSDGVSHAGLGGVYNFGWRVEDITSYMEPFSQIGFTAKTLTTVLLDETDRLYGGEPGDDATACTVRIRRREPVNLVIGPPQNPDDANRMMSLFFAKEGKHIVSGGTTSSIASKFLGHPVRMNLDFADPDIPPWGTMEGADLVSEGVITINRVLEYAKDYLGNNELYQKWGYNRDAASLIARILFEDATDINFFVGRAVNPAHQNPNLPINFSIKMRLVDELADCLKRMGKRIKTSYF